MAVLYSMMPKDFRERVLNACAVAWDGTSEAGAGQLYEKVKIQIKNLAKARREMQGPKPMEVDRIASSRADWSGGWDGGWGDVEEMTSKDDDHDHHRQESSIQYIGKGDGKSKGKGSFQGNCFLCGEFGHPQAECRKGKGKGKGFGKNGRYGRGRGNDFGKGGPTLQRACFGCGATDHLLKDCPKNPNKIQLVQQEEEPEILFIGSVRDDWKHVPMKIGVLGRRDVHCRAPVASQNRFRVLEVDEEDDDEVMNVFAVSAEDQENVEEGMKQLEEKAAFVRAVEMSSGMLNFGTGDIIVDSAADESCWPVGHGDAYPTLKARRT